MNNMQREVERKIVESVIDEALKEGYSLNVNNGGDEHELPEPTTDREAVLRVMFATTDEHLLVYKDGKRSGWVYLIHVNGVDVVSDYSTNLDHIMGPATAISEYYSE